MSAPPIQIQIQIQDSGVIAAMNRIIAAGQDLTPATRAIAQLLASRTEANFAAQSGPAGPWPELSKATLKRRGAGAMMLQDTGRLAGSVTPFWSATEAGIGSNVVYAAIHHLGGKAGRGRKVDIAARAYLPATAAGLQTGVAEAILAELARFIGEGK